VLLCPKALGPPGQAALVTFSLLVLGATIGGAVGARIEHPGHLLVVAVVSFLVDTFSVFHRRGPTATLIAARPQVLNLLALPWPLLGTEEIAPLLGLGDVIFIALYFSAARRHGLSRPRTALALLLALLLSMASVMLWQRPIPALAPMGISILLAHPPARKLPLAERQRGYPLLAALTLGWLLTWIWR
jgi:hypothetical protein